MKFDIELVGKIGSMALINKSDRQPDYNLFARVSKELKPGYIWVSSGATEIGRLDYMNRNNLEELKGDTEENKTDYAAQGQAILMSLYRQFVNDSYSLRQVLVEHQHFNDDAKREHLKSMLLRCPSQNSIPIINYNDAVSTEENRKMEIQSLLSKHKKAVECVDNDETAAQIACLVKAKTLLILTSVDGIYANQKDESTLIENISGKDYYELLESIEYYKSCCNGASRQGANGARAKLEYIKSAAAMGTNTIIANAKYSIKDILSGAIKCTRVGIK